MKTRFTYLLRLFLLLILYFFVARFVFLAFQYEQSLQMGWGGFFGSFLYGLRLDLSITGYVMLLVSLIMALSGVVPAKIVKSILFIVVVLCILVFSLIVIADAELYRHWGFRMDTSVLMYLNTPGEMLASIPLWQTLVFVIVWLVYAALFVAVYLRWIAVLVSHFPARSMASIPLFILVAALMILPIRGSLGIAPVNSGMVYFSNNLFHNHSAVNGVWNFLYDWANADRSQLKVQLIPASKAVEIRESLIVSADSSQRVLNQSRPNVLFIILEGFSSRIIEPLGGRHNVTPQLNRLWNEGIAFTNIYATGLRSDRGLVAILSGYPSHPKASVMKYPKKTERLPSLCNSLKGLGYQTTYYYGGDTHFANMHSYIVNSGFERTVSQDDFPKQFRNSKWGVHDEFMFKRVLADTDTATAPFFKVLFTLSSHEPFDVPMTTQIAGNQPAEKYMNSVWYTDSCLGAFISDAKKQPWWQNTLVVLVADHSTRYPEDLSIEVPQRYAIPMLWLGGAVAKSYIVNSLGNQTDIASTLLNQMDIDSRDYYFSNDLLNTNRKHFAIYIYNQGFGMVTPKGSVVYNMDLNRFTQTDGDTTHLSSQSEGLFQNFIDDFNSL